MSFLFFAARCQLKANIPSLHVKKPFSSVAYTPSEASKLVTAAAIQKLGFVENQTITEESFYDIADHLGKNFWSSSFNHRALPASMFRTSNQTALVKHLLGVTANLKAGKYERTMGVSSSTLVGAKGIGKSTILRTFTEISGTLFPEVIPVYVNYDKGSGTESLLKIVARALNPHLKKGKTEGEYNSDEFNFKLVEALHKSEKRILLVVDELDQIYRQGVNDKGRWNAALETLEDLAWLGSQPYGVSGTLICGSSALIPQLITCNLAGPLREEFPRLVGAPNLNGQKFASRRLPSALPNDHGAANSILRSLGIPDPDMRLVRSIMFRCGSNPREITRLGGEMIANQAEDSIAAARTLNDPSKLKTLQGLLRLLAKRNQKSLTALAPNGVIDYERVLEEKWETALEPITFEEAQSYFEPSDKSPSCEQFIDVLYHLADRSYLSIDGVRNGLPAHIYPLSMCQLCRFASDDHFDDKKYYKILLDTVTKHGPALRTVVSLGLKFL